MLVFIVNFLFSFLHQTCFSKSSDLGCLLFLSPSSRSHTASTMFRSGFYQLLFLSARLSQSSHRELKRSRSGAVRTHQYDEGRCARSLLDFWPFKEGILKKFSSDFSNFLGLTLLFVSLNPLGVFRIPDLDYHICLVLNGMMRLKCGFIYQLQMS